MTTIYLYSCIQFFYLKSEFKKHTTLGFPFIRGSSPHKWNENLHFRIITVYKYYCKNVNFLKREILSRQLWHSRFWKCHSPLNEMKTVLLRWLLSNSTSVLYLKSEFAKHATLTTLGFPFISRHPPWMRWKTAFHDDYYLALHLFKLSRPEEWLSKAYNFGVPVYKGVVL